MSRESIRQAFKTAVASVYSGRVYTTRVTDNREDTEYVAIYIEDGEIGHNSTSKEYDSRIIVRYCKQRATDEALDAVADQLIAAVESHATVRQAVKRPILTGFDYEPDSTHNGLNHIFRILY
tara:strand:- start:3154 stop:3519 length:366 start_codon:yes stop_codon:yes gene_type:complete